MLQPAIDYSGLTETGRKKIQAGEQLTGLCYSSDGCLYVVGHREVVPGRYSVSLAVYQVHRDSGDITLLDRLEMWKTYLLWFVCPRVERHSRRVFVPCRDRGVIVVCLYGDRLVRERTLTCVKEADGVDVMSPDTIYVCDWLSNSVHVVDVRDDRITTTLKKPDTVKDGWPHSLAVLGDSVLVGYTGGTLVFYHHGSPAPVRVIPHPRGLQVLSAVSTDCQRHFMLADYKTKSILVIDVNGELRHTVNINTDSETRDCAVVNRQLWVGCYNGDIILMSSQ